MNDFVRNVLLFVFLGLGSVVSFSSPALAAEKQQEEYLKHPKIYTVEEAYEFFGRERTKFSPEKSKLPPRDVKYMDHLFFVTDMALVARVNIMQYFFVIGNKAPKKYMPAYLEEMDNLIRSFTMIEAPSEDMKQVEKLLILALEEQRDFFKEWAELKGVAFMNLRNKYKKNLLVQASHIKLQRVYTQLMLIYPNEAPYNHKAFFNHLAALDFEPWQ